MTIFFNMAAAIYLQIFHERAAVRGTLKMVKGNGANCPYENSLLLSLDNIGGGYRYCAAEKNEGIVSYKFITKDSKTGCTRQWSR